MAGTQARIDFLWKILGHSLSSNTCLPANLRVHSRCGLFIDPSCCGG